MVAGEAGAQADMSVRLRTTVERLKSLGLDHESAVSLAGEREGRLARGLPVREEEADEHLVGAVRVAKGGGSPTSKNLAEWIQSEGRRLIARYGLGIEERMGGSEMRGYRLADGRALFVFPCAVSGFLEMPLNERIERQMETVSAHGGMDG